MKLFSSSPADLLLPDLRRLLSVYSAAEVGIRLDETAGDFVVYYTLITGERGEKRFPFEWWVNNRFGDIRNRVTEDLR